MAGDIVERPLSRPLVAGRCLNIIDPRQKSKGELSRGYPLGSPPIVLLRGKVHDYYKDSRFSAYMSEPDLYGPAL